MSDHEVHITVSNFTKKKKSGKAIYIDENALELLSERLESACLENNTTNKQNHRAHVREIIDYKNG